MMNVHIIGAILNVFFHRMKMILSSARMPKRRKRRMRKVGTKRTKASIRRKKTNLTLMLMKISKRKGSIGMRWRNKRLRKIDDVEGRASNRWMNRAKSQNEAMDNRRREAASNSSRKRKDVRITTARLGRDNKKTIVLLLVLNRYNYPVIDIVIGPVPGFFG